jgi:integrase
MKILLTETAIKAATTRAEKSGEREELADTELPGLRIRITAGGVRTWVLGARDARGRSRRVMLGEFPAMGVSKAREAARTARAELRKGADPIADARHKRAMARAAKEGVGTLGALLDLYEKKQGAALKSWPDCRRRIESVFKPQLKKHIDELKVRDFQLQADSWPSAQSAAAAVRYIRPILKWAAQSGRGYVPKELADISPPATTARRERVLSRDELERLLPALKASESPYAAAMRLMLLTTVRREEAGAACWRDVDFDAATWTIPETKNGKPHVVPLSWQAVELLQGCRPRDEHGNSITPKPGALIFMARGGGRLANWDKGTKTLMQASQTEGWTRHDLRRTAATLMGEMGEHPHVIEAALNHTAIHSQLATTYNQARYRPEVTAALQRLADALDGIEAKAAKVVALRRA